MDDRDYQKELEEVRRKPRYAGLWWVLGFLACGLVSAIATSNGASAETIILFVVLWAIVWFLLAYEEDWLERREMILRDMVKLTETKVVAGERSATTNLLKREASTATVIEPSLDQEVPDLECGKKWKWRNGVLVNVATGRFYDSKEAWHEDNHFEFASNTPYVRVFDHEIEFGEPTHRCARCSAPMFLVKGSRCDRCGQLNV